MGAMALDPGRLDARLTLQAPDESPDGQGGITGGWEIVADLWGQVEPLRARQGERAGSAVAQITHRVTVRYRDDVRHAMRFVHRTRNLEIRSVRDPDETRRYLVCDCEEVRP